MDIFRIFLLCLVWAFIVQPASSQVIVVKSINQVVIDGKSFYLHTVKQGETRYSISRAYNVSERDIVLHNPETVDVIKIGQELKIPVNTEEKTAATATSTVTPFQPVQFIYHITERGQTKYWLTQHYNISMDELYKHNPVLEHSELQAGQVVTIPQKGNDTTPSSQPETNYIIHKVKRNETVFSIAKIYNVDINRILDINPEIDSKNFRVRNGQEIKIPSPGAVSFGNPIALNSTGQDQQTNNTGGDTPVSVVMDNTGCVETSQKEFRIAMFLPLYLADNAPASAPEPDMERDNEGRWRYRDGRYWIHPRSANALEFFEGARLAIDSLEKQGLNAKIYPFDVMRDTVKMAQLLKSPIMKNMDLMIGPFTTELVDQVRSFARENRIYYVSPIAFNTASLKNNPYLIQVNAGEINTVNPMVDYIAKQENIHVTLIGNKSEFDQTLYNAYLNKLKTVFADNKITAIRMHPDSVQEPVRYLKKDMMNVVIIPSAQEAFVNIITGKLNTASHNFQINLYGLERWTKMVDLDLEYMHTLEFRYATSHYINYSNPQVQRFLQQFRKTYYTEPTMLTGLGAISQNPYQFAFLGYDITYYFVSVIKKYGKDFGNCIPAFRMQMLQSGFIFNKIDSYSGLINTHLDIYKYGKDYTIIKE